MDPLVRLFTRNVNSDLPSFVSTHPSSRVTTAALNALPQENTASSQSTSLQGRVTSPAK